MQKELICKVPFFMKGTPPLESNRWLLHYYYIDEEQTIQMRLGHPHKPQMPLLGYALISDAPTPEAVHNAWVDYFQYVFRTGADPLRQFDNEVQHFYEVSQNWSVRLRDLDPTQPKMWIIQFRQGGGRWIPVSAYANVHHPPLHVASFLNAKPPFYFCDFTTQELSGLFSAIWRPHVMAFEINFDLETAVERKSSAIARDLQKAARTRLKKAEPLSFTGL